VPPELDLHLIADNYATHKHPKMRTWLAQRPRYHMHYTPTYSSWLNQVERWFGLITKRAIRRGSFTSVQELVRKIDAFVQHYNRSSRPFVWTATADSILQKIARLCSRIYGTGYQSSRLRKNSARREINLPQRRSPLVRNRSPLMPNLDRFWRSQSSSGSVGGLRSFRNCSPLAAAGIA
jgi:transposase